MKSHASRSVAILAGLLLAVGAAIVFFIGTAAVSEPRIRGTVAQPTVVITAPVNGETSSSKDLTVRFKVLGDSKNLGIDHAHIVLDGVIVTNRLFFSPLTGEGSYTIKGLESGKHTLQVILAAADHTEFSDFVAELTFTVE